MTKIDELIWTEFSFKEYSTQQWVEIVESILEQLRLFLNLPINHEPLEGNVGEGFCIDIWSPKPLLGTLALSWKGILGGQVLNDGRRLDISATLFLYSQHKKLVTKSGASFLELVYARDNSGKGNWRADGWLPDEYWEYEFFDKDDYRE